LEHICAYSAKLCDTLKHMTVTFDSVLLMFILISIKYLHVHALIFG